MPAAPKFERREIAIASIAVGGEGVGHVDVGEERRAVFVAGAAPGEVVEARVDFGSRPARGALLSVRTASPSRRSPPCVHVLSCGGCPLMFIDEAGRARMRVELVKDTLRDLEGAPIVDHPAPAPFGYRARARIAVVATSRVTAGFRAKTSHDVVRIDRCIVLAPPLERIFALLERTLGGARGNGEASVALGKNAPVVSLVWKGSLPPETFARIEALVGEGAIAGASVLVEGARLPAVIGDPTVWTDGADGALLEIPPGSFAQANPSVANELARHVAEVARASGRAGVELFAGSGTLTIAAARDAVSWVAIESSRTAVAAGARNTASRRLPVKWVEADASAFAIPRGTDVVVLDPPRAGAASALRNVVAASVRDVVYVSCDLATLGRDAAFLRANGYVLTSLHTFDMFPQTSHVETVAGFTRSRRR